MSDIYISEKKHCTDYRYAPIFFSAYNLPTTGYKKRKGSSDVNSFNTILFRHIHSVVCCLQWHGFQLGTWNVTRKHNQSSPMHWVSILKFSISILNCITHGSKRNASKLNSIIALSLSQSLSELLQMVSESYMSWFSYQPFGSWIPAKRQTWYSRHKYHIIGS